MHLLGKKRARLGYIVPIEVARNVLHIKMSPLVFPSFCFERGGGGEGEGEVGQSPRDLLLIMCYLGMQPHAPRGTKRINDDDYYLGILN